MAGSGDDATFFQFTDFLRRQTEQFAKYKVVVLAHGRATAVNLRRKA